MTLPELRQGSTGHFVVKLQGLLNAWGYGLHQDGGFGPLTNNCVRAFQADHGLVVDGIVGQHTWSHLIAD